MQFKLITEYAGDILPQLAWHQILLPTRLLAGRAFGAGNTDALNL